MDAASALVAHHRAIERLEAKLERLANRTDEVQAHSSETVSALAAQKRALEGLAGRIDQLELTEQVWSVMSYVRDATVDDKALVSVILASRNRSQYLPRAIDSVVAQTYPRWELLVVDDGSDDGTYDLLQALGDERIHPIRISHRGLAAARNRALEDVSGDYVAYIDDDNSMHRDWLRSIVWAFTNWPDADLLYGAMIFDSAVSADDSASPRTPWLRFERYSRDRLERYNPTDIGAVAHRAGVSDAVFDEELDVFEDWDLLLRVSRTRDLLALPALAGTYSTTAPDRLSGRRGYDDALRRLRKKHGLDDRGP